MNYLNHTNLVTALSIFISFIFVQSLFFKFSNAPETVHIFGTIADWMAGTIFMFAAEVFRSIGGYTVGVVELIASLLLLNNLRVRVQKSDIVVGSVTTFYGALIALLTMSGAIFFHLFTPLGIVVNDDGGTLFAMAVLIWLASLYLLATHRRTH